MAVNSFNEGAASPLSSVWRRTLTLAGVLLLTAWPSHNASLPPFTASGLLTTSGAVRIWRKDVRRRPYAFGVQSRRMIMAVPQPASTAGRVIPSLIELNIYGEPPEHIRVRFDDRGELSFMQRSRWS